MRKHHPTPLTLFYRYRWLPTILLLLCLDLTTLLAIRPSQGAALFSGMDKLLHIGAFSLLSFLGLSSFILDFGGGFKTRPSLAMGINAVLWLAYGLAIELFQNQLPTRHFSLMDLLADAGGIVLGTLAFLLLSGLHVNERVNS
jgi:VanZ family protein